MEFEGRTQRFCQQVRACVGEAKGGAWACTWTRSSVHSLPALQRHPAHTAILAFQPPQTTALEPRQSKPPPLTAARPATPWSCSAAASRTSASSRAPKRAAGASSSATTSGGAWSTCGRATARRARRARCAAHCSPPGHSLLCANLRLGPCALRPSLYISIGPVWRTCMPPAGGQRGHPGGGGAPRAGCLWRWPTLPAPASGPHGLCDQRRHRCGCCSHGCGRGGGSSSGCQRERCRPAAEPAAGSSSSSANAVADALRSCTC